MKQTYCIALISILLPQGNWDFIDFSNRFPNTRSSASTGFRNRPTSLVDLLSSPWFYILKGQEDPRRLTPSDDRIGHIPSPLLSEIFFPFSSLLITRKVFHPDWNISLKSRCSDRRWSIWVDWQELSRRISLTRSRDQDSETGCHFLFRPR